MDVNAVKYSLICYYTQLNTELLQSFEKLLAKGITIYLFLSYDFMEELDLNNYNDRAIIEKARELRFLNIYDSIGEEDYPEGIVAFDGNIVNEAFYNKVCTCKDIQFNNEQYEIVNSPYNSNIIVRSGAGTGKTTTMINRLMFLRHTVEEFTFDKAVLITFTNKATKEMRTKIIEKINNYYKMTLNVEYLKILNEVPHAQISTIHSFCKSLIDENPHLFNLTGPTKIRGYHFEKRNLVEEILDKFSKEHPEIYQKIEYYPLYDFIKKVLRIDEFISNYSINITSKELNIDFGYDEDGISKLISYVLKEVNSRLDELKGEQIETNDLIKKVSNFEVIKKIRKDYRLIMVDEFQDSDNIQINLVYLLCKYNNIPLFVVGDEKQSIYRFRGAEYTSFKILKDMMQKDGKELKGFSMVRNYRTNGNLLEQINRLFINIEKRVERFNYTEKDYIYSSIDKDKKRSIEYFFNNEEMDIIELFNSLLENKKDKDSIAVIVRNNDEAVHIKNLCENNGILCEVDSKGEFFRHEAVRDFYIMIKSLIIHNDSKVNYSLIESPYIDHMINRKKLIEDFSQRNEEIKDFLDNILSKHNWNSFREKIHSVKALALIDEIIKKCSPETVYYKKLAFETYSKNPNYKEYCTAKALEYRLNLDHLIFLLKSEFADNLTSINAIEDYLRIKIATDNTLDILKVNNMQNKYIRCMTVHKSKGLEFDHVVVPFTTNKFDVNRDVKLLIRNEGNHIKIGYRIKLDETIYSNNIYSNYMVDEKSEIINEEIRLLYVALTRCKQSLHVYKNKIASNAAMSTWENLLEAGVQNV